MLAPREAEDIVLRVHCHPGHLHVAPPGGRGAPADYWFKTHGGSDRAFTGTLDGFFHAGETAAQRLEPLRVGDDVETVVVNGPHHALGHVLRREIASDQLHLATGLGRPGVAQRLRAAARALANRRLHSHGAQDGHADPMRAEVFLECLGQPDHRVLGGVVDAEALGGDEAGHGRGVDDVAVRLLRDHPRHEGLDPVDHAPQVHADGPLPVLMRGLVEPAPQRDAGIVAEDVHRPALTPGPIGEDFHVGPPAHVGADGDGAGARLAHRGPRSPSSPPRPRPPPPPRARRRRRRQDRARGRCRCPRPSPPPRDREAFSRVGSLGPPRKRCQVWLRGFWYPPTSWTIGCQRRSCRAATSFASCPISTPPPSRARKR
jgi:hypothetical protein